MIELMKKEEIAMESVGVEIERKYIIEKPHVELLSSQTDFTASDITQIYLESEPGQTRRIRARAKNGRMSYTETRKIRIDKMSSTEIERDITAEEFSKLAKLQRAGSRVIKKTRYTFVFEGQLFEIDVYPEWSRTAIMETELASRESAVIMPHFLRIIREVTGIREYSNSAMSNSFPPEDL